MKQIVPPYISMCVIFAFLFGLGGLFILQLPFFGSFILIPLEPLLNMYDAIMPGSFIDVGKNVGYSDFGLELKNNAAVYFYASFFALLGATVGFFMGVLMQTGLKMHR